MTDPFSFFSLYRGEKEREGFFGFRVGGPSDFVKPEQDDEGEPLSMRALPTCKIVYANRRNGFHGNNKTRSFSTKQVLAVH